LAVPKRFSLLFWENKIEQDVLFLQQQRSCSMLNPFLIGEKIYLRAPEPGDEK